jgi:hypothetical protein
MHRQEQDIEQEEDKIVSPAMLIDTLFAIGAIIHKIGNQVEQIEVVWQ